MQRLSLDAIARRAVGGPVAAAGQTEEERRDILRSARRYGVGRLVSDGQPTVTDYIAWCHSVNFQFTWLLTGEFGSGKSTLAAWLVYYFYGWGRGMEGWAEAERYFVYSIEDVDRLRAEAARRGRLPLIVVDDAPLQLHSREFNAPAQRMFIRSYQTVREYANTVIFVANNPEEIDVSIRKKVNGVIYVLSPLVMRRYPRLSALLDSSGGRIRAAWFCVMMREPDFRDPTASFRYYVPVHGPSRPLIYSPLPPEVEERFKAKKMMATERVDRLRNILSVRRRRTFRELSYLLTSEDKKVLRALVAAARAGEAPVTPAGLASRTGMREASVVQSLLTLHSVSPALALESAGGWEPTPSGQAFVEQLEEKERLSDPASGPDADWG